MMKYRLIIGIIVVIGFLTIVTKSNESDCETELNRLSIESYNGEIIEKYTDSSNHMFEKVIIKNDFGLRTMIYNDEISGLYEYLKIGDLISKENGNYKLRITRKEKDTIYNIRIYCHETLKTD